MILATSLWSPGENAISDKQPYLVADPLETDYPLVLIGENSITSSFSPNFIAQTAVLASFGAEADYPYLIRQKHPEIADLLIDLSECESGWNNERWGDNGMSHGLFQYQEKTFYGYCQGEWHNGEDQVDCAAKMVKMGIGHTPAGWFNCWRIKNLFKYEI
jgi:hypothetical protein